MDDEHFSEAMFAWKAFLYYRWRIQTLTPALKSTLRSISKLGRRRYEPGHDSASSLSAKSTSGGLDHRAPGAKSRRRCKLYDRAYRA